MLKGTESKTSQPADLNEDTLHSMVLFPTLFDTHIERHTHTHRHIVENCCWRRQSLLRLSEDCQ